MKHINHITSKLSNLNIKRGKNKSLAYKSIVNISILCNRIDTKC